MSHTLELRVRRTEGALGRVLDYVRRRNFEVSRVVARPTGDGASLDLTVTVYGVRPVDPLARNVSRLSDVQRVALRRPA